MMRKALLIELAYGFGDCTMGLPLIEEFSRRINGPVGIATMPHCVDAFQHVPFIDEIISIGGLGGGRAAAEAHGYAEYRQITPNSYFPQFKASDPNHSLLNTSKKIGEAFGVVVTDQRPRLYLTAEEFLGMRKIYSDNIRSIAIESHFKSGQSWANAESFQMIVDKFAMTHRIMMLSPETPLPKLPVGAIGFDDMKRWTRRQCVGALSTAEWFFNVGSGFFCASLSLGEYQPRQSVSLWIDDFYKYKEIIDGTDWLLNKNHWVSNQSELANVLSTINPSISPVKR